MQKRQPRPQPRAASIKVIWLNSVSSVSTCEIASVVPMSRTHWRSTPPAPGPITGTKTPGICASRSSSSARGACAYSSRQSASWSRIGSASPITKASKQSASGSGLVITAAPPAITTGAPSSRSALSGAIPAACSERTTW